MAVLDFEGRGISELEILPLSDRFRSELVRTNSYIVIERNQMEEILNEQGFQLTGCTTRECAVTAGKILNVQKIFFGSIGRVGKTYTIAVSFIDIETARIERSFNRDYRGEIDGLLPILRDIAEESLPPVIPISARPLYISGGSALAFLGFSVYTYFKAEDYYDQYVKSTDGSNLQRYKDDTKRFDTYTIVGSALTAASTAVLVWYYNKRQDSKVRRLVKVTINSTPHYFGLTLTKNF